MLISFMPVLEGLRLGLKSGPLIILLCKSYLRIRVRFFFLLLSRMPSDSRVDLVLSNIER